MPEGANEDVKAKMREALERKNKANHPTEPTARPMVRRRHMAPRSRVAPPRRSTAARQAGAVPERCSCVLWEIARPTGCPGRVVVRHDGASPICGLVVS